MTLSQLIDVLLRQKQRDGLKPNTLRTYRTRTLTLREQFGHLPCKDLARDELLEWIDAETHWPEDDPDIERRGTQKAPDTIRLVLTILKMLEELALDREAIDAPWMKPKDFKKPKGRRRDRLPTPQETESILRTAPADWSLIYQALRLTGARPSELCGAKIEQIVTSDKRRTLVLSDHKTSRKTGRDRKIPIGSEVAPLFDQAIDGRRKGHIFRRENKKPWTRSAVSATYRRLRRQLGLDERIVLYCARHEFGTNAVKRVGIKAAADLMGHASCQTTEIYSHLSEDDLQAAQEAAFRPHADDQPPLHERILP